MSPPPPPPPPPPLLGVNSSTTSVQCPASKASPALLSDIQKGIRLKKTITNDRSAPLIGKTSNTHVSANSASNSDVKSGASGGTPRAFSGGVSSVGGLFANGLPLKPSDNKVRKTNVSVTNPNSSVPPLSPTSVTSVGGHSIKSTPTFHIPAPLPKPSDLRPSNLRSKPSPPPPPPGQKPQISAGSPMGREQYKTMRPTRSDSAGIEHNLRRSGSSEDFSRESTPIRPYFARPNVPPPARPVAPPPPPPIIRTNGSDTVPSSPPPSVSNKFGSCPTVGGRSDEPPPPPPRGASKTPMTSVISRVPNRDAHPLDRFSFKPLSSLPPPPLASQGHQTRAY